jgi:hypothetical protein
MPSAERQPDGDLLFPHLRPHGEQASDEVSCRNADDAERVVVDANITPEHRRIGSETPLPEVIADDRDGVCPGCPVVFGRKRSPDLCAGAKDIEVVAGDQFPRDSGNSSVHIRIDGRAAACCHVGQHLVVPERCVKRVRESRASLLQDALIRDEHQLLREVLLELLPQPLLVPSPRGDRTRRIRNLLSVLIADPPLSPRRTGGSRLSSAPSPGFRPGAVCVRRASADRSVLCGYSRRHPTLTASRVPWAARPA